jgi:hypothetical protein
MLGIQGTSRGDAAATVVAVNGYGWGRHAARSPGTRHGRSSPSWRHSARDNGVARWRKGRMILIGRTSDQRPAMGRPTYG